MNSTLSGSNMHAKYVSDTFHYSLRLCLVVNLSLFYTRFCLGCFLSRVKLLCSRRFGADNKWIEQSVIVFIVIPISIQMFRLGHKKEENMGKQFPVKLNQPPKVTS